MESIWSGSINKPCFEALKGNIKTDVLIIGGGITGLLCAYMLKSKGVECIVAEAGEICGGITKNTTAKITFQHGLIYDKIISKYGAEKAQLYFESQREALEKYRNLCSQTDCDFEECNSFVYSLNNRADIEKEILAMEKIGCPSEFYESLPLPFSVAGAVKTKNQAQFHPLKFAFSIAKALPVYENTKITGLIPGGAVTNYGKITAEKIIVATHFPFINKHGGYFLKMYQHRSYVIALENVPKVKDMYVDEAKNGMSFRSYKGLLILGGGSHRTGRKGGGWQELSDFAAINYPESKEVCRFATQDCMTLDSIPYIGQYSKNTPSLYTATGFNKWGMTSAMTSAMILSDTVQGIKNKYGSVYTPTRSILHPQLALNTVNALAGILTPTAPRCPHMGCALKYNPHEHSWDCPCHGSRFSESGNLIDNPAADDKKNL